MTSASFPPLVFSVLLLINFLLQVIVQVLTLLTVAWEVIYNLTTYIRTYQPMDPWTHESRQVFRYSV